MDEKPINPKTGKEAKSDKADFDRNRDGLYGGLPKARQSGSSGPEVNKPYPVRGN
ncbi:MAG: hypothetical protein JO256_13970 [Alphaproteobacteria bacterium]|nr:hypothetical protein [Alphaproteobacteria bacterium]